MTHPDNRSLWGMTDLDSRRAHDVGDVCDKLIDFQLERLGWSEPQNNREAGGSNKAPASNSNGAA
jgi:hypothetical protein